MSLTGKVLMTCDLARRYGFKDVDGNMVFLLSFETQLIYTDYPYNHNSQPNAIKHW